MNHRLIPAVLVPLAALAFALVVSGAAYAADEDRDRILLTTGTRIDAYVLTEGSEETQFRQSLLGGGAPQKKKTKEIRRIVYFGMNVDGAYRKGMEAKSRGRYEEAADFFGQLADSGTKEWEKIYGAMQEGECWELAHKYEDAAKAYQKVVKTADFTKDDKTLPRHRLWLDAAYHLGVAYAFDKKPDDAAKVVDGLTAYAKLPGVPNSSAAASRADAVRAAVAAVANDAGKLREYSQKTNFRASDELETWFHFNLLIAEIYRSTGKPKDALQIVDQMIDDPILVSEPARKAQAELIKGLCLIDTDPQGAIVELLKIDLLPYGSEDQKCEARYQAGRLMLVEADKLKAKPETAKDDRKSDFVKELVRTSRLLLSAAADSSSGAPSKAEAKAALDRMGPEEGVAPQPKADGEKSSDEDAPAAKPPAGKTAAATPAPAPTPKAKVPAAGDPPGDAGLP